MVPLINNREEALQAVSYCKFPPQGVRSAVFPVRAVYPSGGKCYIVYFTLLTATPLTKICQYMELLLQRACFVRVQKCMQWVPKNCVDLPSQQASLLLESSYALQALQYDF